MTVAPVTPTSRTTCAAANSSARVIAITAIRAPMTPRAASGEPARSISSTIEVSAPGPASSGKARGKTGDVVALFSLLLFRSGRPANAQFPCEDHLGGEKEEQDAAGDAEGRQGDAERAQQCAAAQRERENEDGRNDDAADRAQTPDPERRATHQAGEDRGAADGVDDDEQGDEGVEEMGGHRSARTALSPGVRGSSACRAAGAT